MMQKLRALLASASLAATSAPVIAQVPPPATTAASKGYTPPPVSTTYRPLTGKLFFTDAERDRLDKARKDGVQIVDGEVVARSPQIEGFVRSSGGRTTYWVDGSQRTVAKPTKTLDASPTMIGTEPTVMFKESGARKVSPLLPKSVPQKRNNPPTPNAAAERKP